MGSPSYMSPEQIKGVDVDEGTDIYSLCVVLYELICGVLPFVGSSTADVINKILVGNYKEPTVHVKSLDLNLEDIIVKGLEKKSRDRFKDMKDFKAAVDQVLEQHNLLPSSMVLEEFLKSDFEFSEYLAMRKLKTPTITPKPPKKEAFSSQIEDTAIVTRPLSEKTTKEVKYNALETTKITNPPIVTDETELVAPNVDFGETQLMDDNPDTRRKNPKSSFQQRKIQN